MRRTSRNKAFVGNFTLILSGAFVALLFSSTTVWAMQKSPIHIQVASAKTMKIDKKPD